MIALRQAMKAMWFMRVETGTHLSPFDLVDRRKMIEHTLEDAEARVLLPGWRVLVFITRIPGFDELTSLKVNGKLAIFITTRIYMLW